MIISPKNWMNLVAATLDDLPPPLRQRLSARPELLEPAACGFCRRTWFFLTPDGPSCAVCHPLGWLTAVELSVARPRLSIYGDERIIVSAVSLRRETAVDVVVPEAAEASFRARSRQTGNSAEALQRRVRSVLFRALGLVTDAEGSWGWARGERLQGGAMVPRPIDLADELDDDESPAEPMKGGGS